ncbi:right-handed parallel beta-helix repeat-containing protein [Kibdelosporangium persicum]|uniref:Right handed beta helix region n=1 Tax=Kibdelosporangium persicum TaxID=2698649 RepID=A0ABX2F1W8_9PSEU|nr:right-handed parallel beta-helix repeat-containing protein [Kibdelosporangium persicum]NRN65329.1 Right handed beta helix region [Kibdelosporangium persicum]
MRRFVVIPVVALVGLVVASAPSSGRVVQAQASTVACTNTTNDDEAINNATAASVPGDEIVITGKCLINGTIRLAGERSYRGESRAGTVIRQADGANLDAMLASDTYLDNVDYTGAPVTVRSLTLDGNRQNNPAAHDVLVVRAWQSVIENVETFGATRHGLRVTSLSANGTALKNTQVNGRIVGNHFAMSGGHGVFVEDPGNSVTDWVLADNWVADSGADAVMIDNAAGWMIRGNHLYGVNGVALWADRLFGTTISDNYIEDFTVSGLRVSIQGEAASTITGNRIFDFPGGGGAFLETRVNYGTGVLAVTGNVVRGMGTGVGLDYQAEGTAKLQLTSTGNLVTGVTTPRQVGTGVTVSAGI